VDIYQREACVSDVTWEELLCNVYLNTGSMLNRSEVIAQCPIVLSDCLCVTFDSSTDLFEVRGSDGDAVASIMGNFIYYDDRYSKRVVGINWDAVEVNLIAQDVPEELIRQIVETQDLERAIELINSLPEQHADS